MASQVLETLARSPTDAALYFALGKAEFARSPRRPLAHTLFRTARCLDRTLPGLDEMIRATSASLAPVINLDPNVYARTRTVADELARLKGSSGPCSVIDVGGGRGDLVRFLDADDDYFLAEPSINGISGDDIPFPDKSMDFTASSHVLEHVMPERRVAFLDSMARIARKAFVVLVPVEIGGGARVAERLQFFIDIMDAKWAKEHLACSHPTPEFFRAYAAERGFALTACPVGNTCATSALVLMKHYASLNKRNQEQVRVNRFFNQHFHAKLSHPPDSDQYMFTFVP